MRFFSSILSRFISSSKPSFSSKIYQSQPNRRSLLPQNPNPSSSSSDSSQNKKRLLSWGLAFVPLTIATSAGYFAQDIRLNPSLCDAGLDPLVGGKDSTERLVKGSHKEVPCDFIEELRSFLQLVTG